MKIAIIGAGNVGKSLGKAWSHQGMEICYGVRSPKAGSGELLIEDAVRTAQAIVLAVPWGAVEAVLSNRDLFRGKIVIDCTNPINADFTGLQFGNSDSGGETIARLLPEAKVVKAFNTCGNNIMENPKFPNGTTSMFVAGDDPDAKSQVMELARAIGFDPVDAGPLFQSRYLESLAWLWISMAIKFGYGREIGFALLRR